MLAMLSNAQGVSIYKNVLSDNRLSLTKKSLVLTNCYYNNTELIKSLIAEVIDVK